jgi:hypothetical protein
MPRFTVQLTVVGVARAAAAPATADLRALCGQVPPSALTELHGNVFRERCRACGRDFLRGFDVTEASSYRRHTTMRKCDDSSCRAPLHDTIVYFGEKIDEARRAYPHIRRAARVGVPPHLSPACHRQTQLESAQEAAGRADVSLFVGSSLKVPQRGKSRTWRQSADSAWTCPAGAAALQVHLAAAGARAQALRNHQLAADSEGSRRCASPGGREEREASKETRSLGPRRGARRARPRRLRARFPPRRPFPASQQTWTRSLARP